ncbi:MAG: three-Cys-motif partner protein TcmP [Nitrospinae bacterium]|nr:three-Cys-motif partner protein TcmP [Nitrospinota bacterium]
MTVPKSTLWELDPHTKAKHEILRRYLKAWFPILNSWNGRIIYIDGFSGPGRYKGGELGSPLIALDVAINHRKVRKGELVFWFIDEDQDRILHLKKELQALTIPPHFKVQAESGIFHERLACVLDELEAKGSNLAPTFAFIDPFGFSGIPFALVERFLKQNRCEVFINLMADAINRFLEHPRDNIVRNIVEAFGTNEAIRIAEESGSNRVESLRTLYQSQLRKVAKFVRYFEMRDRNNRVQYYLFFATNNEKGHLKMKEAMWAVDPNGEFRFSDATDPSQRVLFTELVDTTSLAKKLREKFRGQGIRSIEVVCKYVEDETAFLAKHARAVLKEEETADRVRVEPLLSDGKKRRTNTYWNKSMITFT